MKKVLIISPLFPPVNAADMHRVRTSLPYYKDFGWDVEVVVVDALYIDMIKDPILSLSVPDDIIIHTLSALPKKITQKFGLGSVALRSFWQYKSKVDRLLKRNNYDLIYFSTTQFPLLILGSYWKRKFDVPYVIDMQDPWHTDYYQRKPKKERPPKYWFSYRLNKYLEPIAMKKVGGLIAVSKTYIDDLVIGYPWLKNIPAAVIPFGADPQDYELAKSKSTYAIEFDEKKLNIVYTGAVGHIMRKSINFLCMALAGLKLSYPDAYSKIHLYFVGTSYAGAERAVHTVAPIAEQYAVDEVITEITTRIGYYDSLNLLHTADSLLILGSDDEAYNPSKIDVYALAGKPIIGIFNSGGAAVAKIGQLGSGKVFKYSVNGEEEELVEFLNYLSKQSGSPLSTKKYSNSAKTLTREQCNLFSKVLAHS
ncbi:hypothetical protein ASF92_05275 [Pedobacter sp. Leaf176]|nr:hypothetical protein ASF92_05275 [Pedobacter sp. Leaf176]